LQKERLRTSRVGSLNVGGERNRRARPVWTPLIPVAMTVEAVTHFGEQVPI
jgi:hypothetical protein